jgi:hypothetical protein
MNRDQKIKLLKNIKAGKVRIASINDPEFYVFIQRSSNPGIYECNGKRYTQEEYDSKCEEIKNTNSNNIIWNEGLDDKIVITLPDNGR